MNLDFLSAFIIGMLGSGHCLAMCGGITTMLTSAINKPRQVSQHGDIAVTTETSTPVKKSFQPLIMFYHLGRISSYSLIGAIVGFTGAITAKNIGLPITGLRLIAAIFLIFLGLYLGQWLMWLNRIEALGKHLWKFISPLAKHVLPVNSKSKAFGLGALWGWLPCGLVYSMLTWSLASGDIITGAAIMLFFGLGTLPALLALSFSVSSIKNLLVKPTLKKTMAIMLICYGIYSFIVAYQLMF